ncbi:unnamed protein product, partial [Amoebophrya sp. A25]
VGAAGDGTKRPGRGGQSLHRVHPAYGQEGSAPPRTPSQDYNRGRAQSVGGMGPSGNDEEHLRKTGRPNRCYGLLDAPIVVQ